jgi:energy-converting hydrogenase Eha subunit A
MFSLVASAVMPKESTSGAAVAEAIVFSVIMFAWVVEDARRRNVHLSALFKVCVVALGAIAVPIYMIKSRGLRPASKRIAVFTAQFLGCLMITMIVLVALQMAGIVR